jgi:hypothetical protein
MEPETLANVLGWHATQSSAFVFPRVGEALPGEHALQLDSADAPTADE